MKKSKKQYWKGLEQYTNHPEFAKYQEKEFPDYLPFDKGKLEGEPGNSRRDFLKLMGFSVAAASLAACEVPINKAIPYLNKPEDVDPGIANYYASTYINGGDYCSIVVKTREGRPIKIEPNKLSKVSAGGSFPQVQASVLSLYDQERLTGPQGKDSKIGWDALDSEIKAKLGDISSSGGTIRIVSKSILSPSTKAIVEQFRMAYPGTELVMYDSVSAYGMVKANEKSFGSAVIPSYHFNKANCIVSFGCDFLGTWINPIKFSSDFVKNRQLGDDKKDMSRLYQYESNLSLTGANADIRVPIKMSKEGLLVASLYNKVATKAGVAKINVATVDAKYLDKAAEDLWKNRGKSLVVSGSNDADIQILVNAINDMLGNYGQTIDLNTPVYFRQGNDDKMAELVNDMSAGKVGGVIFLNCNPAYDYYQGAQLKEGLKKVKLKISTSDRRDETTSEMDYVAPQHHFLESWDDANPVEGHYSLTQPTITPLFNTRQAQESLMTWSRSPVSSYYDFLKSRWKDAFFGKQQKTHDFATFWDQCLFNGVYEVDNTLNGTYTFSGDLGEVAARIGKNYQADNKGLELVLYQKIAIGDGSQGNNPWLQEMPDPISKACWDNYLTISQKMANDFGIEMFESNTVLLKLRVGKNAYSIPAMVQPGQADGTVGLALGYGRTKAGKVGDNVGLDAFPFLTKINELPVLINTSGIEVSNTKEGYRIPQTQTHQTFMQREAIIQEATLPEYQKDPSAGRFEPEITVSDALDAQLGDGGKIDGKLPAKVITLWKGHSYNNHHWGMAIDLNSCTGCGACTIACTAENNVPVVGRQEVLNRREMQWLRIDRYYSSYYKSEEEAGRYAKLEKVAENPEVVFQPMLCQQCNNAPCETVCPVAATSHSTEGLNQQVYNRCIGTRYCENNCPFKVRRFNWFKYPDNEMFDKNMAMNNELGKMVLNPDVTVRSRGVMEKCTFCVQRIQHGKLEAKKEKRRPKDGEINTACASACPNEAILFGDMNDKESRIVKRLKLEHHEKYETVGEPRAYRVLEELNVKPNIYYFTKIRNKDEEQA